MIKAIIFDFDGVLVESFRIKTRAFAKLFGAESVEAVKKIVNYHIRHSGVSRFKKFRYIYKNILKRKLRDAIFNKLCQDFSKLVFKEVIKAPFVFGARRFLNNYSFKYKCFLVSATPQEEIQEIARKKKILHYFKKVFGSPINKVSIVKGIIRKNNLKPNEVAYIGDALSDFEATVKNSVNFIARIHADNKTIFNQKDCIKIKNLSALENILKTLIA